MSSSSEDTQVPLVMVQVRVYVPTPPAGVKIAVGLPVLLNWLLDVEGPVLTVHAPVPTLGVLAASTAKASEQMLWSVPALAVVAGASTVTTTLVELVQLLAVTE